MDTDGKGNYVEGGGPTHGLGQLSAGDKICDEALEAS